MLRKRAVEEISKIALEEGIEPAVLLAVVDVESAGKTGSTLNGKFEPVIRFEGHIFFRQLRGAKRRDAVRQKLASPVVGRIRNPITQKARYRLLRRAKMVDDTAAIEATSWGVGQVLGLNWRWLGYDSASSFEAMARSGLAGQVQLMVQYIKRAKLVDFLQKQDWAGFAHRYNGRDYARNRYDVKIKAAFERYRKQIPTG